MSNEFINKEVEKIINDKSLTSPLNFAMAAAWILGNLKGINLKIIHVGEKSSLADFYILASASNPIQASAMADELEVQLKKHHLPCQSREGSKESDWMLMDFGQIIVHVFQEAARHVYDLDHLWADSPIIPIPNSYYHSSPIEQKGSKLSDRKDGSDYF